MIYLKKNGVYKMQIQMNANQIDFSQVNQLFLKTGKKARSLSFWKQVLNKTTYVCAIQQSDGEIIGFIRLVDDYQMCIIHDFYLLPHKKESETAKVLIDNLMTYVTQKGFLYTELFDCPADVFPMLQQNGFATLDTGVVFDSALVKDKIFSDDNFHISTDITQVDCKGVDAIFDAVGWGARGDECGKRLILPIRLLFKFL